MNHGWEKKRLGDVCDIYQPKTISTKDLVEGGEYDVFGANGIIGKYTSYNHEEPEVLLTCRGATCGTINVSNPKSWINGNAMVVHPTSEGLSKSYLRIALQAVDYTGVITGAAQPQITRISLSPVVIPIPPLEKQKQIVLELDKINEMLEVKRGQLKDLDMLSQSLFYEMFGDPIENPQGWDMKQIQEFAKTTAGGTPSKSHPEYYNGGKIPWLRSGEVCKMNISNTELCITDLGMQNSSAKLVPVNSVVVAMYGATAAQVGVIRSEMTLNQAISAIFPNSHTKPIFLYFCLSGLKESLLKVAHGAAQPNISQAIIKSTKIILPPIELQNEFSVRVEAIEEQKRVIESTISDLEVLLASRMDYWFND